MDKRVLMATVVSMGLVLVWIAFFGKPKTGDKPTPPAQVQQQQPVATANPSTAQAAAEPAKQPQPAPADKSAGPPAPPSGKPTPTEDTLEEPKRYKATFTSEGAAPTHWVLLDKQYKEDNPKESNKQAEPIDLVKTRPPNLPLEITFPSSAFTLPPDAVWTEQPRNGDDLVYTWESADVRVEKRFERQPGTYQVRMLVTVENKGDKDQAHYFRLQIHGWHDPSVKPGGMFAKRVSQTSAACYANGKVKRGSLDDLLKSAVEQRGDVRWVTIGEQFFLQAAALAKTDEEKVCNLVGAADGSISAIITVGQRVVKPHQKTQYETIAFMGPKILSQLDAVTVGGAPAHLGDVMEYGLWGATEWLSRPMLAVLKGIQYVVYNWGVAIIVLTILLKAVTWYPTQASMKSMKKMAKLKPQMDKLKERFGADKNQLNLATMELYKKEGVNPLGGCLPILLQMPIYIALYSMLQNSVELYRSPFVGWIRDLTAADPYFVLPILTGVLMFVQQRTQPTPPDSQQKMMMYMTPVMFTAFSIFLPAGLTIYILTNTVLTFLQQWLLNRGDKPAAPKAVITKPARA
jgi:YidC/Oxa1 family membrane protein insertase